MRGRRLALVEALGANPMVESPELAERLVDEILATRSPSDGRFEPARTPKGTDPSPAAPVAPIDRAPVLALDIGGTKTIVAAVDELPSDGLRPLRQPVQLRHTA